MPFSALNAAPMRLAAWLAGKARIRPVSARGVTHSDKADQETKATALTFERLALCRRGG
jgi:hypothetical protein